MRSNSADAERRRVGVSVRINEMGVQSPSASPDPETVSAGSTWRPTTSAEKELAREQVARIVATAPFRNSKRFPAFLRHTVEHALSSSEGLKERTIGHEVFGRDPGYDTAQDPIVRMTAGEVRKRLTQYYQLPEHAGELFISYQPGSYVPDFSPSPTATVVAQPFAEPESQRQPRLRRWLAGSTTAAAIVAIAVLVTLARGRLVTPPSAIDRFWAPIVELPAPVLAEHSIQRVSP